MPNRRNRGLNELISLLAYSPSNKEAMEEAVIRRRSGSGRDPVGRRTEGPLEEHHLRVHQAQPAT